MADQPQDDLTGRTLGDCRLLRKLGQGAMGAVYLGEQAGLGRQVALKVLDPKFSRDSGYVTRFEGEAKAAAQLSHFNVVQVYDFGHEGETWYIVNEYVDGGTVQDLVEHAGSLAPERAVRIAT